ncbi:MAG: hypothetical protein HY362_02705 [Candidatus Aenigmarchaeota archaeon]|nr:hypothetical protein [Candidatus Aenigmarchaeota archaeon]
MAREYNRIYAKEFFEKSKRFLELAKNAVNQYPDEAAFIAIQATINANDAFTIAIIGKRASAEHNEAISLHKKAAAIIGESKSDVLNFELDKRSSTGYDIKTHLGRVEAEIFIKRTERFLSWVEEKIKDVD